MLEDMKLYRYGVTVENHAWNDGFDDEGVVFASGLSEAIEKVRSQYTYPEEEITKLTVTFLDFAYDQPLSFRQLGF